MARSTFGGRPGDFAIQAPSANAGVLKSAASLNAAGSFWSAQTGGTQYTDIQTTAGVAITGVSTDADGGVIPFLGPDSVTRGWVSFGGAARRLLESVGDDQQALRWAPSTPYTLGQQVISPNNDVVSAIVGHTSGATYTAANWTLSATYARVFTPEAYGSVGDGVADDTAAVQAAINAVQVAGGELRFAAKTYLINGQLVIPNNAAATYPRQKSMRWVGAGCYSDPVGGSGPYPTLAGAGGTILDLRYTGGGSNLVKIDTRGKGMWESTGITYADQGTSSNPFIKTTNTTLDFHQNAFVGNPTKAGITCDQDAIVLGGLDTTIPGGPGINAAFQGYGTVIHNNYFGRIRRAVLGQAWCNATVIRDNNIWVSCGSNLVGGAAIELNPGTTNGSVFGNVISGNLIEVAGYPYPIRVDYAQVNTISANNFYDESPTTLAYIYCASAAATFNFIVCGYGSTNRPHVLEAQPTVNTIINPNAYQTSSYSSTATFQKGIETNVLNNIGVGTPEIKLNAIGANAPGIYLANSGPPTIAAPPGSICLVKSPDHLGKVLWVREWDSGASAAGWYPVGVLAPQSVVATTGNRLMADDNVVIFNGGASTVTLPTAVGITGRQYTIKNVNAAALTIAMTSAQTIDGVAPGNLARWGVLRVMSDGANWITV